MLDLCGNEKPLYYRRKAMWTDEPFVKIAVSKGDKEHTHVWSDSFVYAAEKGETVTVSCYTNQPAAELFLNGKSLGKKEMTDGDGYRLSWEFPFEEGILTAVAGDAEDTLATPNKAEKLILEAQKTDDIIQIEVSLIDANGNLACADDKCVYYQLLGNGEILGIENGKPDDLTCYAEKYRSTYRGRAIVYIRASGKILLHAFTKDGISANIEI